MEVGAYRILKETGFVGRGYEVECVALVGAAMQEVVKVLQGWKRAKAEARRRKKRGCREADRECSVKLGKLMNWCSKLQEIVYGQMLHEGPCRV